jgi:hypothetical protein
MVHSVQSYLVIILRVAENFASCCTLLVSEAALGKTEGQLTSLTITGQDRQIPTVKFEIGFTPEHSIILPMLTHNSKVH